MGSEELDELIAEALRSYSDGNPRPGLERRVMNRVAGGRPARRKFLPWAFAVAVVIVSIVSPLVTPVRKPLRQLPRELTTQNEAGVPVPVPHIPVRRIVRSRGREVPRAPAPLTDQ